MKTKYDTPVINVIQFENEDVITASPGEVGVPVDDLDNINP